MRRLKYQLPNSRTAGLSRYQWLLYFLVGSGILLLWHATPPASTNAPRPVAAAPAVSTVVKAPQPRPVPVPSLPLPGTNFPRPVLTVFEAQVALDREGLSPGSIDGRLGPQTRAVVRAFQTRAGLPGTGDLDAATRVRLTLDSAPVHAVTVCSNDLKCLHPLSPTWLGKSQQTALDYESVLEWAAEKSHAHPGLIRSLNPSVDWTNVVPGTPLLVPDIEPGSRPAKAAFARILLNDRVLEVFDEATNLLNQFPCSIAQRVDKRPVGELHVAAIAPNPNYTFDPELFPDSPESRQLKTKLILPPGPNNPVGSVWIGLDRAGYGIHGTPNPEMVGRTESHGCFRLANWNAELLMKMVWVGMPVYVEP